MSLEAHPRDRAASRRRRVFVPAARIALQGLLAELSPRDPGRPLLLPAYVGQSPLEGSGVFDPVRSTGVPFDFYRVDAELGVVLDDVARLLEATPALAVLLVHFFGRPDPATLELAELCRQHGVPLIEDCAHVLGSRIGERLLGRIGSYALHSLHKVLPTETGGMLETNDPDLPHPALESLSADAEAVRVFEEADLEAIARRRLENHRRFAAGLREIPGVEPFWAEPGTGTIPMNAPIRVVGVDRFALYRELRARGIGAVALYHTLVAEIPLERFPTSRAVSAEILNLPIHQDVGPEDVDECLAALEDSVRRLRAGGPTA